MSFSAKILKAVIKGHIRPYLAHDLTFVEEKDGCLILDNLQINPEAFSQYLPGAYHIIDGYLNITINMQRIIDAKKLHVRLTDVDILIGKGTSTDTAMEQPVPQKEEKNEIERNSGSFEGANKIGRDISQLIDEMEITIENLTLRYRSFSHVKQNLVCVVLKAPVVHIEHITREEFISANLAKRITLPEEFELYLEEPDLQNTGQIKSTMIADGPMFEGIGSESLAHTFLEICLQESPTSIHYSVQASVRSLRAVMDPLTLQVLMELLDLDFFPSPSPIASNVPTLDEMDEEISEGEFKDAACYESDEESDEFEDCDDAFPDLNESILVQDDMFVSFMPQNSVVSEKTTTFDIKATIKQATLTLLVTHNPIHSSCVFCGKFDINNLTVPAYAPCDHTTFYIADVAASAEQSVSLLSCKLEIPACGIAQFSYQGDQRASGDEHHRWWSADDFVKSDILSFRQNFFSAEENTPIFKAAFRKEQIISSSAVSFHTETSVQLGEIVFVIDDQVLPRFIPYLTIVGSALGSSESEEMPRPVPKDVLDSYETEIEQCESKSTFSIKAEAISLRLCSSDPDALESILLDVEGLDISSSSLAQALSQEWMIDFKKITASLDKGYNNVVWFFHTSCFSSNAPFIPMRVIMNQNPTPSAKVHPSLMQQQDTDEQGDNGVGFQMMEDYDFTPPTNPTYKEETSGQQELPLPIVREHKVYFEGKAKSPTVAEESLLQEFTYEANLQASMRICIILPNCSIDITKENYDLLLQLVSELSSDFTKSLSSVEFPSSTTDDKNPKESSMIFELNLNGGTFDLREAVRATVRDDPLGDEDSKFQGSFKKAKLFYVNNYGNSGYSYLYSSLEAFEIRDCAPHISNNGGHPIVHTAPYRNFEKMLAVGLEMTPTGEKTLVVECYDALVEYAFGADWIARLQTFFQSASPSTPVSAVSEVKYTMLADEQELPQIFAFGSLNNLVVRVSPSSQGNAKFSVLLLLDKLPVFVEPFTADAEELEIQVRGSGVNVCLLDDIEELKPTAEENIHKRSQKVFWCSAGYRYILELNFLQIQVLLALQAREGVPPLRVVMKENRASVHLCQDSLQELLHVYGDFSLAGLDSESIPSPASPAAEDETTFYDAKVFSTSETAQTIFTVEDYDPSLHMTQLNLSDDSPGPQPHESPAGEVPFAPARPHANSPLREKKEEAEEEIEEEAEESQAVRGTVQVPQDVFDVDESNPFDMLDFDDDNSPAAFFDTGNMKGIDKNRKYVVYVAENAEDIPEGAVTLTNQSPPESAPAAPAPATMQASVGPGEATSGRKARILDPIDSDSSSDEEDFVIGKKTKIPLSASVLGSERAESPDPEPIQITRNPPGPQPAARATQRRPFPGNRTKVTSSHQGRKTEGKIKTKPQVVSTSHSRGFVTLGKQNREREQFEREMAEFELIEESNDKVPVVRIRNDLVESTQSHNTEGLPCMLGVPVEYGYTRKRKRENMLDLPEEYPTPSFEFSIEEFQCEITLYDGRHWDKTRQDWKPSRNKIEIGIHGLCVHFYAFGESSGSEGNHGNNLAFRVGLRIKDFEILDKLEASNRNVLLGYPAFHLRAMDSPMLSVLVEQSHSIENRPPRAILSLEILPLHLNLDQDARYFLTNFLSVQMPDLPPSNTLWEEIRFSDVEVYFEYKAKRMERLTDVSNLLSIENSRLKITGKVITEVTDMGEILKEELIWEMGSLILNAILGLGPLGPLVNLTRGVGNLFYRPYREYKQSGRIFRGVREGVSDFGTAVASESLNFGSKIASGSQMILQFTDNCLNTLRPESSRTEVPTGPRNHPANAVDGLQQGMQSIQRETQTVYRHFFVIPYEEYESHGLGGAANALLHAFPVAVLRPAIGIAEGARNISLGARNQIGTKEIGAIYKK